MWNLGFILSANMAGALSLSPFTWQGQRTNKQIYFPIISHCHQKNSWFPMRLYEVPFHLWNQGTGKGLFVLHSRTLLSLDNHIEWLLLCCVTHILEYIECLTPSFTSSSFLPPKYVNRRQSKGIMR